MGNQYLKFQIMDTQNTLKTRKQHHNQVVGIRAYTTTKQRDHTSISL